MILIYTERILYNRCFIIGFWPLVFWCVTVLCHCTCVFLHLAFLCVFTEHVYYVWLYVLFLLSVYVISLLVLVMIFAILSLSTALLIECLLHISSGPHHYLTHLSDVYFTGLAIVLIIAMTCDCNMHPQSPLWTATVDPVGINAYSLRVSLLLSNVFYLNFNAL